MKKDYIESKRKENWKRIIFGLWLKGSQNEQKIKQFKISRTIKKISLAIKFWNKRS